MSYSLNGISKPFAADVFVRYIYKTHKEKKIEDEEGMKSDSRTQERRNELLSITLIFFFSTSV